MTHPASPIFRAMKDSAYTTFLAGLGRRLGAVRRSRGLSQERVAQMLDMDRVSIGYIEQGRRSPRLATLYDVRVTDFFDFEETADEVLGRLVDDGPEA